MSRLKIAAGNWKMNKTFEEGLELAKSLSEKTSANGALMILGTPFIHLKSVCDALKDSDHIKVAAQNCSQEISGAYTGETSVDMIASVGAEYVILGHSERREYFKESDALLASKTDRVLAKGLIPIFCCGEPLSIREAGTHVAHVKAQLEGGLFHLDEDSFSKIVIAYEPIWAIGTGVTASPEQAQEMQKAIRDLLAEKYGKDVAEGTSILYGGSVKPGNAKELFSQPDVDGGLVGGASLKADDFAAIYGSF